MLTALVLLLALLALLVLGVPVIMTIAGATLVALVYAGYSDALYIAPQQVLQGVNGPALLAVPFFILAGNLLSALGMADRIYNCANALMGHFRAGLAQVNVLGSMIFSGISGAAVADLATIGKVEIIAMKAHGYKPEFAAAVTAASSILGPIIPPSIPLLIYGFVASTSVGRLFLAGVVPGLLIGLSLMVYIRLNAIKQDFPTQPRASLREMMRATVHAGAALAAPGIILFAMLTGYSTATEAGVVACIYSIVLGMFYRTLSLKKLWEALTDTTILTALIMLMLGFSTVTGWLLSIEQIPQQLAASVLSTFTSPWAFLAAYLVFFLILNCVFETLAALIVLMPMVLPIVDQFGIDRVHFGIVTVYVMMIGIVTPPMGLALFILVDVSGVSYEKIAKATLPFMIPLILSLILITFIPSLSLWLPNLIMGKE